MMHARSIAAAALLLAGLASAAVAQPTAAQPTPARPSSDDIIQQLRPGRTRGVQVPNQQDEPPAVSAPGTTAPPGVPALSMMVYFATGSATLSPRAELDLAQLGQALRSADLAPYRFRIEGHTDSVGDAYSNQLLSQRRAAAVRDYLVKRFGIDPARLEAVGLGETQLLVPTPDEYPEFRNRRVQVLNISS